MLSLQPSKGKVSVPLGTKSLQLIKKCKAYNLLKAKVSAPTKGKSQLDGFLQWYKRMDYNEHNVINMVKMEIQKFIKSHGLTIDGLIAHEQQQDLAKKSWPWIHQMWKAVTAQIEKKTATKTKKMVSARNKMKFEVDLSRHMFESIWTKLKKSCGDLLPDIDVVRLDPQYSLNPHYSNPYDQWTPWVHDTSAHLQLTNEYGLYDTNHVLNNDHDTIGYDPALPLIAFMVVAICLFCLMINIVVASGCFLLGKKSNSKKEKKNVDQYEAYSA